MISFFFLLVVPRIRLIAPALVQADSLIFFSDLAGFVKKGVFDASYKFPWFSRDGQSCPAQRE
jgi:hypothetical protein